MRPFTSLYFSPRLEDGIQGIQMIVLDFNPYQNTLPAAELADCVDWTMLDGQLALLRNLGVILLVFESPKDLQFINDQIIKQKLPHLCRSPKLRYVVTNEKDHPERRWLRCTPNTFDQGTQYRMTSKVMLTNAFRYSEWPLAIVLARHSLVDQ